MSKKFFHGFVPIITTSLFGCSDKFDIEQAESIVKANCKVCHAQGINGAPIIGNQSMWGPRVGKGKEALVQNVMSGVGLMPAKGGKDTLTQAEIELAVEYFLTKLKK